MATLVADHTPALRRARDAGFVQPGSVPKGSYEPRGDSLSSRLRAKPLGLHEGVVNASDAPGFESHHVAPPGSLDGITNPRPVIVRGQPPTATQAVPKATARRSSAGPGVGPRFSGPATHKPGSGRGGNRPGQ